MAYLANIPQAGDKLSQSQADILANFVAIGELLDPNSGAIIFPQQGADHVTPINQVALYSKDSPSSPGTTALFFRPESNGTPIDITSCGKTNPGWLMLPCGIIVKWGQSVGIPYGTTGTAPLVNGAGIPNITTLLWCMVTLNAYSSALSGDTGNIQYVGCDDVGTHLVSGYASKNFASSVASASFKYLAIGY